MPYFDTAMHALSCNECLCAMFLSSMNSSILSLNCVADNNNGVICELFNQTITQNLNSSQIKINLRSTFYFQLLSVYGQSQPTSASRASTEKRTYFIFSLKEAALDPFLLASTFRAAQTYLISSELPDFCKGRYCQKECEWPRPYVP